MFRKCCDRVVEVIENAELCYYMVIFARERARGLSRVGQKMDARESPMPIVWKYRVRRHYYPHSMQKDHAKTMT
jgi:hypothetical protein